MWKMKIIYIFLSSYALTHKFLTLTHLNLKVSQILSLIGKSKHSVESYKKKIKIFQEDVKLSRHVFEMV